MIAMGKARKEEEVTKVCSLLREHGVRITNVRRAVVKELLNGERHRHVEELCKKLASKGVSRASVYRTLSLLEQTGFVSRVLYGERHSHFEFLSIGEHHDHLICIRCGRIVEFESSQIERLQKEIARKYSFELKGHVLEIRGVCPKCKRGSSKRSKTAKDC
ncbi:MAG: hypothetical protein HZRFUVUK_000773 [Candidatus Fervidibacterota bacterium]